MVTVDLDPNEDVWSLKSIDNLAKIYSRAFNYASDQEVLDFEFAVREGQALVQRYVFDADRNRRLFINLSNAFVAELEPVHQEDRPLSLRIGIPGVLDTLVFKDNPEALTDLRVDFIEITPRAFGVNLRDVMVAMGQLQSDFRGLECAGIVRRVSSTAASQGVEPGDRVAILLRRGHFSSRVRSEWTKSVKIPDEMSFETAATIPIIFATAYISLFDMAGLKKGESVLIHTGAGGVGQAAIILAQHIGAEVFVTAGTVEKRELLTNRYGIPSGHIFSSRDAFFATGIKTAANGRGVDVVLNSLAGSLLQASFNCVAQFGRFVELGKRDFESNNSLALGTFTRNVTFSSLDILQMEEHRGGDVQRVMRDVIALFQQGAVTTAEPVTVYPLMEVEKAFRLMQAGKHLGKIVVTVDPEGQIPVLRRGLVAKLHADASHLTVGGLGGIGKSICHWMVERGARNIIVLSRSANREKAGSFIDGMARHGCRIEPLGCDTSNHEALRTALDGCVKSMPPIRGVIQAAMVLQDSILEQMTLSAYRTAILPKVHGSWNLHTLFPTVDFFVMLSSLSGIVGQASQCNYGAGNTYQDALARHRRAQNLHGASIDIGAVKSVGYLAERKETLERLVKSHYRALTNDDVLKATECAIVSPPASGQMLLGLHPKSTAVTDATDARFIALRMRTSHSTGPTKKKSSGNDLSSLLESATSLPQVTSIVISAITRKLADIFMLEIAEISPSNSVAELIVDSLVAVELRNMLALKAGSEVSIFHIMQSASIAELGWKVARKSSFLNPGLVVEEA